MTPSERSRHVLDLALDAGFDLAAIAPVESIRRAQYYIEWLEAGRHGEMEYLRRTRDVRVNPARLLDGARAVIVLADSYWQKASPHPSSKDAGEPRGRIARYAWGRDYHRVMRKKLDRLAEAMRATIAEPLQVRCCVDTAPIIEREAAAAAGLGWIGKNTLVVHPRLGSFFFLGAVVTTLDLEPGQPMTDHCGTCRRCLDACPTGALTAPYQMDARRCVSYLTIEHRSDIPGDLAARMGDWVYGCDVCQEVCPRNRSIPVTREPAYEVQDPDALAPWPVLTEVAHWSEAQRQLRLAGSAMKRASLAMWHRNAALAARNKASTAATL
ncbi:MAG TPA: tRNA epoxyqueuosine(34) reductase QueG [Phycisphaerae bacterium]|nr:tRNA epoxyqueuosine(34) reductase QueG [Phycisphaerae bacterium]HRY68709.1 tRNA epoxyqueuosine(34) reductase QueG [Phycisphaerae bacterium]HSA25535.1 tRNA epoxyqueuosine(34) reductase QueG [Phycisphaerae bacterium]